MASFLPGTIECTVNNFNEFFSYGTLFNSLGEELSVGKYYLFDLWKYDKFSIENNLGMTFFHGILYEFNDFFPMGKKIDG